jgi:hypothetical protein
MSKIAQPNWGTYTISTVILGPGSFTVHEFPIAGFTPIFSRDCKQTATGSTTATGTISEGQTLVYNIVNIIDPWKYTLSIYLQL